MPFPVWAILLATIVGGGVIIALLYLLYRCCRKSKAPTASQEYATLVDDGATPRYS